MANVLLPNKDRNIAGASINPGAVLEAVEFLELERPVEIKWAAGIRRRGAHRNQTEGHVITVSTYLDAEQLNITLLHELIHAAQAERFDSRREWAVANHSESRRVGYHRNQYEVEARELADDFSKDFNLAR